MADEEIDIDGFEKKVNTLMNMIQYVSTEQCKDEKIPKNALVSVFLGLAQDVFEASIEDLVNNNQNPQAARNFLRLHMKLIQSWVKKAQEVDDQLEEMLKK
ncbi:MAG: hypothetical protein V3V74_07640 [Nitrosomonadaceae bacterium]